MSTMAFPDMKINIESIYVPLRLEDSKNQIITINKGATDIIINKYRRIKVIDNAGMGKSTVSKIIILDIIQRCLSTPIFIELRTCGKDASIFDHLSQCFSMPKEDYLKILDSENVFISLDGLDEVVPAYREKVVKEINNLSSMLPKSTILVTSRAIESTDDLEGYERFTIKKFNFNESLQLLAKLDTEKIVYSKLEAEIKTSKRELEPFLGVPLYVTLLFRAYLYKAEIPNRLHLFLNQIYEALYSGHDLKKEIGYKRPKISGLDSNQFQVVLRIFAFSCLKNGGKLEFTRDEAMATIDGLKKNIRGFDFSSSGFVTDLIETVQVFIEDGPVIRWSHKLLMEYFSALYVCYDMEDSSKAFKKMIGEKDGFSQYYNVLSICSEVKYASFRKIVTYAMLKDIQVSWRTAFDKMESLGIGQQEKSDYAALFINRDYVLIPASDSRIVLANLEKKRENPVNVIFEIAMDADFPDAGNRFRVARWSIKNLEKRAKRTFIVSVISSAEKHLDLILGKEPISFRNLVPAGGPKNFLEYEVDKIKLASLDASIDDLGFIMYCDPPYSTKERIGFIDIQSINRIVEEIEMDKAKGCSLEF